MKNYEVTGEFSGSKRDHDGQAIKNKLLSALRKAGLAEINFVINTIALTKRGQEAVDLEVIAGRKTNIPVAETVEPILARTKVRRKVTNGKKTVKPACAHSKRVKNKTRPATHRRGAKERDSTSLPHMQKTRRNASKGGRRKA